MATSYTESLIIAQAVDAAWGKAAALYNNDPQKIAQALQAEMSKLADRVALLRMVAVEVEKGSTPEAFQARLAAIAARKEAAYQVDKAHGQRLAEAAKAIGQAMATNDAARRADMARNGASVAGM